MNISSNLKYLRQKQNLSQQKLAEEIGFSRSQIASYECGMAEPGISKLLKLSRYFDITIDQLIATDLNIQKRQSRTIKSYNKAMTMLYHSAGIPEFAFIEIKLLHEHAKLKDSYFKLLDSQVGQNKDLDLDTLVEISQEIIVLNKQVIELNELMIQSLKHNLKGADNENSFHPN